MYLAFIILDYIETRISKFLLVLMKYAHMFTNKFRIRLSLMVFIMIVKRGELKVVRSQIMFHFYISAETESNKSREFPTCNQ